VFILDSHSREICVTPFSVPMSALAALGGFNPVTSLSSSIRALCCSERTNGNLRVGLQVPSLAT
jgi:hypothetical protein